MVAPGTPDGERWGVRPPRGPVPVDGGFTPISPGRAILVLRHVRTRGNVMTEYEVPGPGASPDEIERVVVSLRRAAGTDPDRYLPEPGHGLLRLGSLIGTEPGR